MSKFWFILIGDWQTKHLVPGRERVSELSDGGFRLGRDGRVVLPTSTTDGTTGDLFHLVRYRRRRRTTSSRTNRGCFHLTLFRFAVKTQVLYIHAYIILSIIFFLIQIALLDGKRSLNVNIFLKQFRRYDKDNENITK